MLRSALFGTVARLTAACSCSPSAAAPAVSALGALRTDQRWPSAAHGTAAQYSSATTDRPQPTRELLEIIRKNGDISTAALWREVQDRHDVSESARAIPNKRQMKLLLKFMKRTFKVKASKGKAKSYLYRVHPLMLRREQRAQAKAQQQ
ncbi:hypothetical protein HKI87_01g08140 [Chloropicon roscoffensis]|uniref:Uncharacterized protein n=1 Tax=Chloropicon roscoffensis TaxID=1461544 RepID=A0A7S3CC45_9CHLO|mmetsp:Transcript_5039/g.15278  ORF Transcript_5039/g.15278 Transcript_5039/m.15278 type:complete len:149 (+) Transcript_5039:96-542(+)